MKNLQVFTSILITMFFCCMLSAQCPDSSISFTSQQAIDDFAVNYPGCAQIDGHLIISSSTITDLTPLSSLTSINGNVTIYANDNLNTLSGLENIDTITGNLLIGTPVNALYPYAYPPLGRNNFADLTGLDNLQYVGGSLEISDNNNLLNLNGLSNLTTIEGSLVIGRMYLISSYYDAEFYVLGNDNLMNLNGLDNLSHVGNTIQIVGNAALSNLSGLGGLTTINGNLIFYANHSITNFSGLNLTNISGSFILYQKYEVCAWNYSTLEVECTINHYGNNALLNFEGMESLTNIGGSFLVVDNNDLVNFEGLNSLHTINGSLLIGESYNGNSDLVDLSGLGNLTTIGASVVLAGNNSLADLSTLDHFIRIEQDLRIINNNNLADLSAFNNITHIGGNLQIGSNNILSDLSALNNLEHIGLNFQFHGNSSITDFSGLENLTVINGSFQCYDNAQLSSFSGLQNITNISENFDCHSNSSLNDFNGLDNLTAIGSHFSCYNNEALLNFNGLDNLTSIGGNFLAGRSLVRTGPTGIGTEFLGYDDLGNNAMLNFNGVENLTHIGGTLSIGNNDALSSLSGFENLTNLGGLFFYKNDAITDFDGLNQVDSITGNVIIGRIYQGQYQLTDFGGNVIDHNNVTFNEGNEALAYISGFNNLIHIEGNMTIGDNAQLNTLSGFQNLTSLGSGFDFYGNHNISDFTGLENLHHINTHFNLAKMIYPVSNATDLSGYIGNDSLTTLAGLENLNTVGGDLTISANNSLISLSSLENLQSIGESLIIGYPNYINNASVLFGAGNQALTNISIPNNPIIESRLEINNNNNLSFCNVPFVCTHLDNGGLHTIQYNASGCSTASEVQTNCAMPLPCPEGNVTLSTQQEVNGFAAQYPNCTEITGNLYIGSPSETLTTINDVSPLNQLTAIQGKLTIIKNDLLSGLSGLENLTTINGDIYIGSNPALSSLADWNNLTSTGGRLIIRNNALNDLNGFNSLTSIAGYINIGPDTTLTSLAGLENLTSMNGYLYVHDNIQLNSLNGLDNIDHTTITDLRILDNPQLSICNVPSICNYLEYGSTSEINNNASGCNTQAEIETACIVDIEVPSNNNLTIAPNPSEGTFIVKGIPQGTYQIHDTAGRIIQSGEIKNDLLIDISQETRGVYFISIQIKNEVLTKRMIKL